MKIIGKDMSAEARYLESEIGLADGTLADGGVHSSEAIVASPKIAPPEAREFHP
jgi:hypothetical protein